MAAVETAAHFVAQFDTCIEQCFLAMAETKFDAAVAAVIEAEESLVGLKKVQKLDAARRRPRPGTNPLGENAARDEVCARAMELDTERNLCRCRF